MRLRPLVSALLCFGLVLPFVGKPVHVDDANFLVLAEGAAADPWRPHAVTINWQGTTERAFDVLSNPPGVAWWLAPVVDAPVAWQHLWMLPWLALALFGAWRLGRAFAGDGVAGLLVLGTAPVVALAAQSLTPDLPLLACALAGVGGFLTSPKRAWAWALVAGAAALFRYSGVCLIPLLLFAGWQRGRLRAAALSAAPLAALLLHDLAAYGEVHLLAMTGFQSVSNTPREVLRKGIAALAMLGGVGVLPLLAPGRRGALGALAGAALGLVGAWISGHDGAQAAATVAFTAAGGAAFGSLRLSRPEDRLLAAWTVGGFMFLLTLRFTAARYWLPFLAGPALAALRAGVGPRRLAAAIAVNALVALGVSFDDLEMARGWQRVAAEVSARGSGQFAGHWGWQRAMEAAGWRALEEGEVPTGLFAVAWAPWPQEPGAAACLVPVDQWVIEDRFFGPRVHTAAGAANVHAFVVAGLPPTETYAPWTLSDEPYDRVSLYRPCGAALEGPAETGQNPPP
ncbi:MAG: hypothetical protein H6739_39260 [Alphaproteobacteria bacterium]|nr:hypothetical protein [Alphaproteobacteria bacterium]